jgi:hypothetical protein
MDTHPYMLLFRNTGPENHHHLSPEERQQLIARWNDWFEGLLKAGKATEGQPLESTIHVVRGPAHQRVVDGPFSETKESVGGYVKLRVGGLDEAIAIANAHPGLEYGLVIEVRSMTPDCHLGVTTTHATTSGAS